MAAPAPGSQIKSLCEGLKSSMLGQSVKRGGRRSCAAPSTARRQAGIVPVAQHQLWVSPCPCPPFSTRHNSKKIHATDGSCRIGCHNARKGLANGYFLGALVWIG